MMKKTDRKLIKYAKKLARDKIKYERKSVKLFIKFKEFEGFSYRGYVAKDKGLIGDDYIIVTDPNGECHTYYVARNKEVYNTLKNSLILELAIRYKDK